MEYGINGNKHNYSDEQTLRDAGIEYLGDGEWRLPDGWESIHHGEDNWSLTSPDGDDYAVWTEE